MAQHKEPQYLYLTTTGRRTGLPREIEIWFTSHDGRYYLIAERREQTQWVQNLLANPVVQFRIGGDTFAGRARIVAAAVEPDVVRAVRIRSQEKYGWGDGLIVELTPDGT